MRTRSTHVLLLGSMIFFGCSSTTATLADGGAVEDASDDAGIDSGNSDAGTSNSSMLDAGTCALMSNTTATSTITSGCTLATRDVSSCKAMRQAAGLTGAWLKFSCRVTLTKSGNTVTLVADSQPDHKSNYFASADACYTAYKTTYPNPNSISAQTLSMTIPLAPTTTGSAMGLGVVGAAINGVYIYDNVAAPGDDIFREAGSFDQCQGHPSQGGKYHYHSEPYSISSNDSNLIGIMRDGYFIYGRLDADNSTPTLDAKGGHTAPTPDSVTPVYHYHPVLQISTTAGSVGTEARFLAIGTYYGTPGACMGCQ